MDGWSSRRGAGRLLLGSGYPQRVAAPPRHGEDRNSHALACRDCLILPSRGGWFGVSLRTRWEGARARPGLVAALLTSVFLMLHGVESQKAVEESDCTTVNAAKTTSFCCLSSIVISIYLYIYQTKYCSNTILECCFTSVSTKQFTVSIVFGHCSTVIPLAFKHVIIMVIQCYSFKYHGIACK